MPINEAEILESLNIGIERPDPFSDAITISINSVLLPAVEKARDFLLNKGSGSLAQSVAVLPIVNENGIYKFQVECDYYGDFVNQGVNGTDISHNSEFSFNRSFSHPGSKHVEAIRQWIPSAGLVLSSSHPNIKTYDQMAWAIATSVRKKGIKPTHFIERFFGEEFMNDLSEAVAVSMGYAVLVKVERVFNQFNKAVSSGPFK